MGKNPLSVAASGAGVSLIASIAAWASLLARFVGGPWVFIPMFLLLGATGLVVGLAAIMIERTRLAGMALLVGCVAPVTFLVWLAQLPPDAFG